MENCLPTSSVKENLSYTENRTELSKTNIWRNHGWLSAEGDIYMGGVNGLLCIDKQLPDEDTVPPVLELADVAVGGERMNAFIKNRNAA